MSHVPMTPYRSRPLVVDLDGTLLRSDVLIECVWAFLKSSPLRCWQLLVWLLRGGKAGLKARLAAATDLDVTGLPYDASLLAQLAAERAAGRALVLATATHQRYAQAIADHLGCFDEVHATEGAVNLSARRKRDRLIAVFGERGFDYAGNSHDDVPVWASAARAWVVNPERGVERAALAQGNVDRVIENRPARLKVLGRALRLHQWLKNLLIFVPVLTAHQFGQLATMRAAGLAFVAFGFCASSVYLLNDLIDLEDDRHHPTKRNRPLASGALPLRWGVALCPVLLAGAVLLEFYCLPLRFAFTLFAYYALTLAYSLYLKRLVMVDVVVLAALYTARIVAGAAAIGAHLSFWLLAFSMFVFLSLALVKRYAELQALQDRGLAKTRGRGYQADDLSLIASLGSASGYLAVLVLALYIQDRNTALLYRHPPMIWPVCAILLYWVSRIWLITHRGQMHDDPVLFAAKDRASWLVIALCAACFWMAI
ncbi:UbiA family prenyltransferase [Paraburkholderia adhaesiva]|uniref:UbiA family prenyltransferase n=1 Tax=Paraburkholderia adhaesiva TaxID=2883244 RepID=UPI001F25ED93|nr:UbiA family prenyltransferase [Paraburkholderia adhaesiva]